MKLLHCMLSKKRGGVEESFIQTTKALISLGHEVSVLVHKRCQYKAELAMLDVKISMISFLGDSDPLASYRIKNFVRKIEPEIIIAQAPYAISYMARARKNTPETKLIGVYHNKPSGALPYIDKVVALTEPMMNDLIQAGLEAHRCLVIPNMIAAPEHLAESTWHQPIRIGMVGPLEHSKGGDVFIRALRQLKHQYQVPFQAYIVGRGSEKKKLQELCYSFALEKYVTFLDHIESKASFFSTVDVLCVPSRDEPFGMVILEAFLHRTPVIATRLEGLSSIIEEERNGLLVNVDDDAAFAQAITMLANHPDYAKRLVENATRTLKGFYSIEVVGQQWEALLNQLVADQVIEIAVSG